MSDFRDFMDGYTELLRRRFGTKRVHCNIVYQEYISERDHVHMNSTQWETLTDFVKWLGREGLYSKTGLKRPLKKKTKIGFQDQLSLNAGQKYCRMLQGSILQHFRPSLSYHMSLRSLFFLLLSGRLRQVVLYEAQ